MNADDGAERAPASAGDRRARLAALIGDDPSPSRLGRLCAVAVSEVGVDGAGLTVRGSADPASGGHRDQLAETGPLTRRLADLHLTAGEGPGEDAIASGAPALAPDLVVETTRWLGFAPEAIAAGVAAVFSLPLQVGAVRFGTLDLHRGTPGELSRAQLADALTLAALATETLLERTAVPDPHADPTPDGGPGAGWLPGVHADVHVASGIVSVRLGVDIGAALLCLRAHAFASGEPIGDIARRVVDRDLVLDHLRPGPTARAADPDTDPDTDTDSDTDPDGPAGPNPSREDDR